MKRLPVLLALLLTGCLLTWWQQNLAVPGRPAPPCTPVPLPTGERIFPVEYETAPPTNVFTGQPILIRFSGGVLVPATGQQCGDNFSILFPNQATAEATIRVVQVTIDGEVVLTHHCGYDCTLFLHVQLAPGEHQLELVGVFGAETHRFYAEPFDLT
jgi:hypothetical protein